MSTSKFFAHRHPLRPGSLDLVREWQRKMQDRSAEVLETLRAEGVELELVLLESTDEGDSLVFILRTADFQRAVDVFMASTHPIDAVHRKFLEACSLGPRRLEVVGLHELPAAGAASSPPPAHGATGPRRSSSR